MSGNLALTNASDESVEVTIRITDRESEERLLEDSYRVPASDDGLLVEDAVTTPGSYDVTATVTDTDETASERWRLSSGDGEDYSIRVAVLSDGRLEISGDGI